ncbi:hypothetical protein KIPB_016459, partial [Kipferlia bialata]
LPLYTPIYPRYGTITLDKDATAPISIGLEEVLKGGWAHLVNGDDFPKSGEKGAEAEREREREKQKREPPLERRHSLYANFSMRKGRGSMIRDPLRTSMRGTEE